MIELTARGHEGDADGSDGCCFVSHSICLQDSPIEMYQASCFAERAAVHHGRCRFTTHMCANHP